MQAGSASAQGEEVFKALADTTRVRIVQLLQKHELSVSELVAVLRQPQSTVSRHLRVLRDAALVSDRRDGASVLCSVPVPGTNGEPVSLQARLLEWAGGLALPKSLERRLERVLNARNDRTLGFFQELGHRWDQIRIECFGERFHLEALASLLPREWTVADIGTGTGYLLPTLASCFRKVIAIDPVEAMLETARSRLAAEDYRNVEFRRGDLSALPIADAAIDLGISVLVLHHVPSPDAALAELRRVVRPGGRVLLVEQRSHDLSEFHERMQDRWWGFEPGPLSDRVAQAGFTEIAWRPLRTAEPTGGRALESPDLFVLTGVRA